MNIKSICYYYPPLNSSEGYASYKLYKWSSNRIDVISQKKFHDWTYSNDTFIPKNTIYLDTKNINEWNENIKHMTWHDVDILITRSMPQTSHLLGLDIKKKNPKIKWVTFFSDPFSKSPIGKLEYRKRQINNFKKGKIFSLLLEFVHNILDNMYFSFYEKKIYKKCDYIIFNNEYQKKYMCNAKYFEKIKIIPHTFDYTLFNHSITRSGEDKIIFAFAGSISEARNIDSFLQAVKIMKNEKKYSSLFEVHIISNDVDNVLKNISLEDVVIVKNLPYKDCLEYLAKADWLINSDASETQRYIKDYIYLPCKLVDYLSINKNVLNISNFSKSPSIDLVKKCEGVNIQDNTDLITNFLKEVIDKKIYKNNPSEFIKKYSSENVSKDFDLILKSLF